MSLAERIKAAEESATKLKDDLTKAIADLEAVPEDETLLGIVEDLTGKVTQADKSLEALKRAETALAARAKPITPDAPSVIDARKRASPQDPGDIMVKHAVCFFLAHVEKKTVSQVIAERYPEQAYVKATWDHMVKIMTDPSYQKSQVDPAMTTTTGWAAELVRNDVRGYIDTLKDISVAAALQGRATSLVFDGYNTITIPKRNPPAGAYTEPAWVAEGAPIPLTRFSFGSSVINRYKLAAITTFTKEIAERSTPAIEGILRDALREAHAEVLDGALLSTAAGVANVRPAGLRSTDWGSETRAGAAGGGEDAVRADIMAMLSALTAKRLGARPVLMINNLDRLAVSMITSAMSEYVFRDELNGGNLLGIPVISSANVPQHLAVMVDAAYLATAFDLPSFDVSDVATVVEASADATPPTHASDAAGAAGTAGEVHPGGGIPVAGAAAGAATAGYKARSLWQTYSIGMRMIAPTSWNVMQQGAVQSCTATTWSA